MDADRLVDLFSVAYSPGEGPVPFVRIPCHSMSRKLVLTMAKLYSAESMPLYVRDVGK